MIKQSRSNGYALLIVLIAVAILLVLVAIQIKTILPSGSSGGQSVGIESRPWLMEELLVADGEDVKRPKSPKPTLTEPVTLQATALLDDMPRGTVDITFNTDGRIEATWNSAYSHTDNQYTITAGTKGNVVPQKTCIDENGEKDKSRLFFVTKGRYEKRTLTGETVISTEKGTAWLSGCLKPDHTIEGFVSIHQTTDWTAVYTLTTQ